MRACVRVRDIFIQTTVINNGEENTGNHCDNKRGTRKGKKRRKVGKSGKMRGGRQERKRKRERLRQANRTRTRTRKLYFTRIVV